MKKISVLFIAFLILFCGCEEKDPQINPNLIKMEITYCDSEKISYKIINNCGYGIEFGSEYNIEYLEENDWIPVAERTEAFFNAIAYGLASGEENVFSINTESRYGALSDGKYRIIKDISLLNEDGVMCGSQRIFAEFEVSVKER